MAMPSGSRVGRSLAECTARSIAPARSALSSSFVNRPLPPASDSGRSWIASPVVLMTLERQTLRGAGRAPRRDGLRLVRLRERQRRAAGADDEGVGGHRSRHRSPSAISSRQSPTPSSRAGLSRRPEVVSSDEVAAMKRARPDRRVPCTAARTIGGGGGRREAARQDEASPCAFSASRPPATRPPPPSWRRLRRARRDPVQRGPEPDRRACGLWRRRAGDRRARACRGHRPARRAGAARRPAARSTRSTASRRRRDRA